MPVQRPRDWKRERDAEASAGLEESGHILVEALKCQVCNIGIGPNHLEQKLYVYPVYHKSMWDGDDNWVYVENTWMVCCGSCAHHKRRNLPDLFLLIDYQELRREKKKEPVVDLSIEQRIDAGLFLLSLYLLSVPVRLITFTPAFSLQTFLSSPAHHMPIPKTSITQRKGVNSPTVLVHQHFLSYPVRLACR